MGSRLPGGCANGYPCDEVVSQAQYSNARADVVRQADVLVCYMNHNGLGAPGILRQYSQPVIVLVAQLHYATTGVLSVRKFT
jgi:hypothetical protein